MDKELIKAHLNLCAVLQNIEELVKLDPAMAALVKSWDVTVQFEVSGGPTAYVEFKNGVCRHGMGRHPHPTIRLFFLSGGHLNGMFAGKASAIPIPLKGFTRLGFLKAQFSKLTDRLTYYLKPAEGQARDAEFVKIATTLSLYTAIYAVKDLALMDPTCRQVAAHIPAGTLQVEVLQDGPVCCLTFGEGRVGVAKGRVEKPSAKMIFRNLEVTEALLTNKLDGFLAVAQGDVALWGIIPMIDSLNVILDRVPGYLLD